MSIFLCSCNQESKVDVSSERETPIAIQADSIVKSSVDDENVSDLEDSKIDHEKNETQREEVSSVKKSQPIAPPKVVKKKRTEKALPEIHFEEELYDFGRVVQGEKVLHEYVFTNNGSSALVISDAVASCGCTQPIYPFIPIEPGQTGKILVQFNSKGRLGRQSPTIKVFSNASNKSVLLKLVGEVVTEKFNDGI